MALKWLIITQIFLFCGSFLAGNIPLSLSLSESKLRLLSAHGAGLMVGTAFNVILPEGVGVLYSVKESKSSHLHRRLFSRQEEEDDEEEETVPTKPPPSQNTKPAPSPPSKVASKIPSKVEKPVEAPSTKPVVKPVENVDQPTEKLENPLPPTPHHEHESSFEPHQHIGPPIAFGFALMLLIDQLFQTHPSSQSGNMVQMTDFRTTASSPMATHAASGGHKIISTTFGLVVHAMADGIAMGAAAASNRGNLELLVFLAIMLHKAPSAFGLVTFLLHEGASRRTVRQHLFVFSLAAPVGALLTYFALVSPKVPLVKGGGLAGVANMGDAEYIQMTKWTGILLLFSAGTFLYVSLVHILPEVVSHDHSSQNGSAILDSPAQKGPRETSSHSGKLTMGQLIALLLGLALPYFLTIEHSH